MDVNLLAKYPFHPKARIYVQELGMAMDDLIRHPIYSACTQYGLERIQGLLAGEYADKTKDKLECELTILSYPCARLIAHSTRNKKIVRDYSQAEAGKAFDSLKREKQEFVWKLAGDIGLRMSKEGMHFLDYLPLTVDLAENPRWALANQVLENGVVEVKEWQLPRLIAEWVKMRVREPIDKTRIPDELVEAGKQVAAHYRQEYDEIQVDHLEEQALPPCITKIISNMEQDSANHQAMFILGTFLINLGLKNPQIHSVFQKSPKYKHELAEYQIQFLSGEKSNTRYTCPACETIKNQGYCPAECNVKHPLQYYRRNARRLKAKPKKQEEEKEGEEDEETGKEEGETPTQK